MISQGHIIINTKSKVFATRDGYSFKRDHDVVSLKRGVYYLTEVKFREHEEGRKSLGRKMARSVDPRGKLATALEAAGAVGKILKAGNTVAQLYHDVTLESDVNLTGKNIPGGEVSLSEMEGEVVFRWELWSDKKDQTVVNTSAMKRAADPNAREEFAKKVMEQISVQ